MKDCHPSTEQQKVALLEDLYEKDGRHDDKSPNHGLYTGLYVAHLAKQAAQEVA